MKKIKLNEGDKILSIGAGGYIKKCDRQKFIQMIHNHDKELKESIKSDLTGEGFIKDMFLYELANHEYCLTNDLTETLEVLGLTNEEINNSKSLKNGLNKAIEEYINSYREKEFDDEMFGE